MSRTASTSPRPTARVLKAAAGGVGRRAIRAHHGAVGQRRGCHRVDGGSQRLPSVHIHLASSEIGQRDQRIRIPGRPPAGSGAAAGTLRPISSEGHDPAQPPRQRLTQDSGAPPDGLDPPIQWETWERPTLANPAAPFSTATRTNALATWEWDKPVSAMTAARARCRVPAPSMPTPT